MSPVVKYQVSPRPSAVAPPRADAVQFAKPGEEIRPTDEQPLQRHLEGLSARGLDFPNVTKVINFDFPATSSLYLHRAGRTARRGTPSPSSPSPARRRGRARSKSSAAPATCRPRARSAAAPWCTPARRARRRARRPAPPPTTTRASLPRTRPHAARSSSARHPGVHSIRASALPLTRAHLPIRKRSRPSRQAAHSTR